MLCRERKRFFGDRDLESYPEITMVPMAPLYGLGARI